MDASLIAIVSIATTTASHIPIHPLSPVAPTFGTLTCVDGAQLSGVSMLVHVSCSSLSVYLLTISRVSSLSALTCEINVNTFIAD